VHPESSSVDISVGSNIELAGKFCRLCNMLSMNGKVDVAIVMRI